MGSIIAAYEKAVDGAQLSSSFAKDNKNEEYTDDYNGSIK